MKAKRRAAALLLILALLLSMTAFAEPAEALPEQKEILITQDASLKDQENVVYIDPNGFSSICRNQIINAIQDNTCLVFDDGIYVLGHDWGELGGLRMSYKSNVTLRAKHPGKTELLSEDGENAVIYLHDCDNITLSGLNMGHTYLYVYGSGCSGDELGGGHVVSAYDCTNLTIDNCDLWGCGIVATSLMDCENVTVTNSVLRDCVLCAVSAWDSTNVSYTDCIISGNWREASSLVTDSPCVSPFGENSLTFTRCTFLNNHNYRLLPEDEELAAQVTMTDCVFQDNQWDGVPKNSGVCFAGGITWEIERTGTQNGYDQYNVYLGRGLTFEDGTSIPGGTGEVPVYSENSVPWKNFELDYNDNIHIVLSDGVTLSWHYHHDWGEAVTTQEATCGYYGYQQAACKVCGKLKYIDIPPTGNHMWDEGQVMDGYTLYTCTSCYQTKKDHLYGNCGLNGSNITWTLDGGVLVLSGSGEMADNAYEKWNEWGVYNYITKLVVEEGVTSLGNSAFRNLSELTEVSLPESLTKIGFNAFDFCKALKSLTIPAGVTEIGPGAFQSSLAEIHVAADNPAFMDIDGVLFTKDGKTLVAYPWHRPATSYKVPDGVETIGRNAFYFAENLTELDLNSVKTIEESAFWYCTGLSSITLPATLTELGEQAFNQDTRLAEILVESGSSTFQSIDGVLYSKDGKTLYLYPEGKPGVSYTVPDGVEYLESHALYSLPILTLTLPDSLIGMEPYAIYYCRELCSVTFLGNAAMCYSPDRNYSDPTPIYYLSDNCVIHCSNDTVGWTDLDGWNAKAETLWDIPVKFSGEAHHWTSVVTKEAGCTETGEMLYTCSDEGCTLERTRVTAPTGHCYTGYEIYPSLDSEGCSLRICVNCGDQYREPYVPYEYDPDYSELHAAAAPTQLTWGVDWSSGTAKAVPGMISFYAPAAGTYIVEIYKAGTSRYLCDEWIAVEEAGWVSSDLLLQQALSNGNYRFIVQTDSVWNVMAASEPVISDSWKYTAPDAILAPCTGVTMNGREVTWTEPEDSAPCGGYSITLWRSSREAEPGNSRYSSLYTSVVDADTDFYVFPASYFYQNQYYYVTVQRISADITAAASSEAVYSNVQQLDRVESIYAGPSSLEVKTDGDSLEVIAYPSEVEEMLESYESTTISMNLEQTYSDVILPEALVSGLSDAERDLLLWIDDTMVIASVPLLETAAKEMEAEDKLVFHLDEADRAELTEAQKSVISADDTILELSLTVEHYTYGALTGTTELHELHGELEVRISDVPLNGEGSWLTLARIDPDGSVHYLPVNQWGNQVSFETDHLSVYRLAITDELDGMLDDVAWHWDCNTGIISVDLPAGDSRTVIAAYYSGSGQYKKAEFLTAEANTCRYGFTEVRLMLVDTGSRPLCEQAALAASYYNP